MIDRICRVCSEELSLLGRELRAPSTPFERVSHGEAVKMLRSEGFDLDPSQEIPWKAEERLSRMHEEPLWIYDYPMTARGFYDLENPDRPGVLKDLPHLPRGLRRGDLGR